MTPDVLFLFFFLFKDASEESIDEVVTELVESLPAENKSMLMYLLEHLYK